MYHFMLVDKQGETLTFDNGGKIQEAFCYISDLCFDYYYDVIKKDDRFAWTRGETQQICHGLIGFTGKTASESLKMLSDMIGRIKALYQERGYWIDTDRHKFEYYDKNERPLPLITFDEIMDNQYSMRKKVDYVINEGDVSGKEPTAAKAVDALEKMKHLASVFADNNDAVWVVC